MVDKVGSAGLPGAAGVTGVAGLSGSTVGRRVRQGTETGLAFDRILQQQLAPVEQAGASVATTASPEDASSRVRFSAHAQQRLAQADVQLGPQALAKLEAAVDRASQKGGKESLILLDDLAFVVSVKNRTVITAVGADRMADNVFTKIDSVVFARGTDEARVAYNGE